MLQETKEKILRNRFVFRLYSELAIDKEAFEELCQLLHILAKEWNDTEQIDKQMMHYLYPIATIVKGVGDGFAHHVPERASEIWDMAAALDAIISEECLWNSSWIDSEYMRIATQIIP